MLSFSFQSKFFLVAVAIAALAEAASIPASIQKRPNIIVIQPDDHLFLEEWNPPARFERQTSTPTSFTSIDSTDYISPVPNINRIKNHGVEMTNAYAASTMCGTSRYSTLTGRLPSRSSYGRQIDQNEWNYFDGGNDFLRKVTIPRTKLEDTWGVPDSRDCTSNNLAATLKQNGYSTGVVGKWHLESTEGEEGALYDYYPWVQDKVRHCGFDFAEAIYRENLNSGGGEYNVDGGLVTHNMEHLTAEAIRFIHESVGVDMPNDKGKKRKVEETIDETKDDSNPFFLYFNPTVPHDSGDVTDALRNGNCKNTVQGWLSEAPYIPYGMTADFNNCYEYRQSVLQRAARSEVSMNRDKLAGAVWIDDAIGSLFQTLEALDILDNTLILFQLDHGMDAKGSLFEGGSKIVQFVHYPDQIKVDHQNNSANNVMLHQDEATAAASPQGWKFEGLVSTIDIAPTIMDLAGVPLVTETAEKGQPRYQMDGKSWFSEMLAANAGNSEDFLPQKQQRQQKPIPANENYFQERCLFTEEGLDRSVRCGCYKYIYISDPSSGFTVRDANAQGVNLNNHNYFNLCDENTGEYISSPESSPELWPTYYRNRISNDIKNQLWNKVACLAKQTDPSRRFPDYETDCGLPLTGISSAIPSVIETVDNESSNDLIEDSTVNPELDEPAPSVIETVDNESPNDLIEDSTVNTELDEPASLDIIEEPQIIELFDNESPKDLIEDAPMNPELKEPASLDIIEEPQPGELFLRTPSSSSTTSSLVDTVPITAIALTVSVLLLVLCILYWVYREIYRRSASSGKVPTEFSLTDKSNGKDNSICDENDTRSIGTIETNGSQNEYAEV